MVLPFKLIDTFLNQIILMLAKSGLVYYLWTILFLAWTNTSFHMIILWIETITLLHYEPVNASLSLL